MLKELRLTNIVLVESAAIAFGPGFNVLSGESGAGKSAIMNGLNLIAGDRSDPSIIRRGADKGAVEAVFDIEQLPQVAALLDEAGIDHEPGSDLLIRRELSTAGKSRAFINHQMAQAALLRHVSAHLFEIVGQHANQKLFSLDYHRQVLDLYGDLKEDISAFAGSWEEENAVRHSLEKLICSEAQRIREIEVCRMEIEELKQADVKEGEEEEVFAEYSRLSNADELAEKSGELTRILSGEKGGVLQQLRRSRSTLQHLTTLAPALSDTAALYENALLELDEVSHALHLFESRIEHDPSRAAELNARMELLTRLKRKYGATASEIHAYLKRTQERLADLENSDAQIEALQERVQMLTERTHALALKLTEKRRFAASELNGAVVAQLRALNMPKVEFFADISPQKRTRQGDDKIEFYLTPNVGEHRVCLKDCASGGELSRVMLALQAILAGKEQTPTLIFDEVDANIGGETAAVVGEKLKEIGKQHQILCITHFYQVAQLAEHHLRIFKKEIDGRTVTFVDLLNEATRGSELARMLGQSRFVEK